MPSAIRIDEMVGKNYEFPENKEMVDSDKVRPNPQTEYYYVKLRISYSAKTTDVDRRFGLLNCNYKW